MQKSGQENSAVRKVSFCGMLDINIQTNSRRQWGVGEWPKKIRIHKVQRDAKGRCVDLSR